MYIVIVIENSKMKIIGMVDNAIVMKYTCFGHGSCNDFTGECNCFQGRRQEDRGPSFLLGTPISTMIMSRIHIISIHQHII